MSVRLLTTALILLLQSTGQTPSSQDPTVSSPPAAVCPASLLCGAGLPSNAASAVEVAQHVARMQADVFPLFRLADEYAVEPWKNTGYGRDTTQLMLLVAPPIIANQVEELECLWQLARTGTDGSAPAQARDRRWSCRQLGMMALGHLCPPLRLCSFHTQRQDPCLAMVRRAARQCGALWAGCFAQAPSRTCPQGCPYPYGRPAACEEPCQEPVEECQESQPIEDCSAAQPEAIEGLPQEAESSEDRCTCCNGKCQCTNPCACSKDAAQCSCCNQQCCCNEGKCQCSACPKDKKCACADGQCACKDGACKCAKTSAVKHECPYLKAQAAQARAKAKFDRYAQREVTVLDNLEKLARARRLHEKAQRLEKAGAKALAEHCYRQLAKICPGSRYEALAQAGLAALRTQQTLAQTSILDQARQALEQGDFDQAYRLAEQAYGEAYAAMSKAAEMLRVIDARYRTSLDLPGVEEAEPKTCDPPLPCEPQAAVPESLPIAVEVKVAEYLEACQRALTAGCFDEAQQLAQQALELDPACGAAELLLEKARAMIRYEAEQEQTDACIPEKGEEPCEIDPEAQRLCPMMPAVDPAIVHGLQRLLAEQDQCLQPAASEEEQQLPMPADWQYLELYIDPEECDGYRPAQPASEAPDREPPLADAGELIRQLIQAIRGGSCIEVDTGSSQGPRVWIQVGGAHCRVNLNGSTVHFVHGGLPADPQPAASCEVSIHIKWGGQPLADQGCRAVENKPDLRDWQVAHEQEVIHWIESMNSGGVEECEAPADSSHDDEDADVNRDPCDG